MPSQEPARTRHVLVVDDNRDVADMVALFLRRWGYHPLVAYDGPSALEMALTGRHDAVLLDIGLPGMDGHEVARRIRWHPGLDRVLVVAMSGDATAGAEGIDLHLRKPFDPEDLRRLLGRALAGSAAGEGQEVAAGQGFLELRPDATVAARRGHRPDDPGGANQGLPLPGPFQGDLDLLLAGQGRVDQEADAPLRDVQDLRGQVRASARGRQAAADARAPLDSHPRAAAAAEGDR
jgi:CheY-like chemotaxis protein